MKGKISLGDFIREVKKELVQATKDREDEPFFALTDVELEASFSLEAEGEVGMKFIVETKGTTTASQVHKVTLKFKILVPKTVCNFPGNTLQQTTYGIGYGTLNVDPKK